MTRETLAVAIDAQLGATGIVTAETVGKIESGRPIERYRYWPVLAFLELHGRPSPEGPREGEDPGGWLRDLRETHGIAPEAFCRAAVNPETGKAMSRATLARLESGTNQRPVRLATFGVGRRDRRCCRTGVTPRHALARAERRGPGARG